MLELLEVNNIAIITSENIEFENGLNVITGETGAGKSLLVNSIGILLGNKIDKNLLRSDSDKCRITGKFSIDNNQTKEAYQQFCNDNDFNYEEDILITRTYDIKGKNEVRINGQLATIAMLKQLTGILVDAYFQNDNQKIFDKSKHLEILDDYAQTNKLEEYIDYQNFYNRLNDIDKEIEKLGGNENERLTKIDLLSYQLAELDNCNFSQEEYDELLEQKHIMSNAGKIISNTTIAYNNLSQQSIQTISQSKSSLASASQYDERLNEYYNRLESVLIELNDIKDCLDKYNQTCEFSEDEQIKIEERLDYYHKILRKYSANDITALQQKHNEIKHELDILQNSTQNMLKLQNIKKEIINSITRTGRVIHEHRKKFAIKLVNKVTENLKQLGMKNAILDFEFNEIDFLTPSLYKNGLDSVELMFSANLGECIKPLAQIASGGEISRFMLALKAEIANSDSIQTIVFDEIDTGISGVAVEQVAKLMAKISRSHQVIAVTHSAQICAMADTNYMIYKNEENGNTSTHIKKLDASNKVVEVARFLSGENVTKTSLANAQELIHLQNEYKNALDK